MHAHLSNLLASAINAFKGQSGLDSTRLPKITCLFISLRRVYERISKGLPPFLGDVEDSQAAELADVSQETTTAFWLPVLFSLQAAFELSDKATLRIMTEAQEEMG